MSIILHAHYKNSHKPISARHYQPNGIHSLFGYCLPGAQGCAGGSVLSDPFSLTGFQGYVANPYPTRERLREIPLDAAVGIVGSGLTAVDVAVSLKARGHSGPVRLYSRSGVLPLVRRPGPDRAAEHLTVDRISAITAPSDGLRLADLERLFNQEVQAWGGEARGLFPPPRLDEPRRWLRWQLEHPHDREDLGTFIFQKSVPSVWGDIWYALSSREKQRIICRPVPRDGRTPSRTDPDGRQCSRSGNPQPDVHRTYTRAHPNNTRKVAALIESTASAMAIMIMTQMTFARVGAMYLLCRTVMRHDPAVGPFF